VIELVVHRGCHDIPCFRRVRFCLILYTLFIIRDSFKAALNIAKASEYFIRSHLVLFTGDSAATHGLMPRVDGSEALAKVDPHARTFEKDLVVVVLAMAFPHAHDFSFPCFRS